MFREVEIIVDINIFCKWLVLKTVNMIFYHVLISALSEHLSALGKEGERHHVEFALRLLFPHEENWFFH